MKKLIMIMFCMILLVGTATAWEFDNKITYENNDMKVTFINAFGLGKDIGTIELKSHKTVEEIKEVGLGNQVVMWYEFDNFKDIQKDGLGEVTFTNMKTGEEIERNYIYVYWGTETREKDVWGEGECTYSIINQSNSCKRVVIGKEEYTWEGWLPYNSKDIPNKKIIIGIETYAREGDYIDGVWTIVGKKVKKHSTWTAGLNINIVAYYRLNGTAVDEVNAYNGAEQGAGYSAGHLNDALTSGWINVTDNNDFDFSGPFSISLWFKTNFAGDSPLVSKTSTAFNDSEEWAIFIDSGGVGNIFFISQVGSERILEGGTGGLDDDAWHHVVVTRDGSNNWVLYVDNSSDDTGSNSRDFTGTDDLEINAVNEGQLSGRADLDEIGIWKGRALSVAEVSEIFNSSTGFLPIFIINPPDVTLNSPADNAKLTNQTVIFNCTASDNIQLVNVSLFIEGLINETNSSGINNSDYLFPRVLVDGNHNWTCQATDNESQITTAITRDFSVDSVTPNVSVTSPRGALGSHIIGTNLTLNFTALDTNVDSCFYNYNNINTTINCSLNTTSFTTVASFQNLTLFVNDTAGNLGSNFTSWTYSFLQNNVTFNSTTLETKSENFKINIDSQGQVPSSAILNYDGTNFTSVTITNTGGDIYDISKTIQIPTSVGVKDWLFIVNIDSSETNSPTNNQTVSALDFGLCNGTLTTPFINFTFKNESLNEESLNATVVTSWRYSLGAFTTSKTLSYSNATENLNYPFCLSASNEVLNINLNMTYTNGQSQQRAFTLTSILSNVTTTQVLYLLATGDGLFSPMITQDALGDTVTEVKAVITRILNAATITVISGLTDGSGLITFFLDPDELYTATFTKSGFTTNTFQFTPTTDLRTVVMGGTGAAGQGSNISEGLSYRPFPKNTTLLNNTDFTFGLEVNSTQTISFIGFIISNSTGNLLQVNQTGNGTISGVLNTGNNTRLFGTYTIQTANETIIFTRTWLVGQDFVGEYSIFNQFTLFLEYGFSDFIRLLIVIFTIIAMLVFISAKGDIEDEIKTLVILMVIWAYSVVGWLDTGVSISTTTPSINALTQFSSQYGIAIISSVYVYYFTWRRISRLI